ncbi:MAG: ECF transporter S component [Candidatus Bathyarchaeota archaeon]|nr:ECF transporter S component [Candidatus Bathyarchaeota archaeon]
MLNINRGTKMNTRALSLIIIFTALAAALNIYGPKIPFPLYPFLYFQLWEIPIVTAFLMIGPRSGLIVGAINTLILLIFFQGYLPSGPFYNFAAVLAMFVGIYLPYWLSKRKCKDDNFGNYLRKHILVFTASSTGLAIVLRVLALTVINYFALPQPYPIGLEMPQEAVLVFLPLGAIFNAIVALYTIPIAIAITALVMSRVKFQ